MARVKRPLFTRCRLSIVSTFYRRRENESRKAGNRIRRLRRHRGSRRNKPVSVGCEPINSNCGLHWARRHSIRRKYPTYLPTSGLAGRGGGTAASSSALSSRTVPIEALPLTSLPAGLPVRGNTSWENFVSIPHIINSI